MSAAEEIDHDEDARAVVVLLRGGRRPRRRSGARAAERERRPRAADGVAAVAALRVPVVAALQGEIVDEAFELGLACDLRVAGRDARLGLTQVVRGELPRHGGTQRLPRLAGRGRALQMLLLGEVVAARAAHAFGIVHDVVAAGRVEAEALRLAERLAARGPIAQRLAKEALAAAFDLPLAEGLRLEGDLYVLLQSTRDRDEGIASFRERRAPAFTGR